MSYQTLERIPSYIIRVYTVYSYIHEDNKLLHPLIWDYKKVTMHAIKCFLRLTHI